MTSLAAAPTWARALGTPSRARLREFNISTPSSMPSSPVPRRDRGSTKKALKTAAPSVTPSAEVAKEVQQAVEDFLQSQGLASLEDLRGMSVAAIEAACDRCEPSVPLGARARLIAGAQRQGSRAAVEEDVLALLARRLGGNQDSDEDAEASSGSSSSSSASSSSASRPSSRCRGRKKKKKKLHRRQMKQIQRHMQRTAFELADPMPLVAEAVAGTKFPTSWPLDAVAPERIAPTLLPQIYGKFRRATLYAKDWQRCHGQENTPIGKLFFREAHLGHGLAA